MIARASIALTGYVHYTYLGSSVTGLVPDVTVVKGSDGSTVVTAAATELSNGLYKYTLSGAATADTTEYLFHFRADSANVDQRDMAAAWVVSSGLPVSTDAVDSIAVAVWEILTSTLSTVGSIGKFIVDKLTTGPVPANVVAYGGKSIITGTVQAGSTEAVVIVSFDDDTAYNSLGADALNGMTVWWLTGSNKYSTRRITASSVSAPTNVSFTVDENWPVAPDAGDTLIVLPEYLPSFIMTKLALITAGSITVSSPLSADGLQMTVIQGDDYSNDDDRAFEWSSTGWPDITAATVTWSAKYYTSTISKALTIVSSGGATQTVRLELTDAETKLLTATKSGYRFDVQATLASGNIVTLVSPASTMTVTQDITDN